MIAKVLKEPFLYFLLIGGSIFLGYQYYSISKPIIEIPSNIEDQNVQAFIQNEVLFQEALKNNLHKSDAETRQRLIQSMSFLLAGQVESPDQETLQTFYQDNQELYKTGARISLDHHFFENDPSGQIAQIMTSIENGEAIEGTNEFWLGSQLRRYEKNNLIEVLGQDFAEEVFNLGTDVWVGPLESNRGFHFVKITEKHDERLLSYGFVADRVLEDWHRFAQNQKLIKEVQRLQENYRILRPGQ